MEVSKLAKKLFSKLTVTVPAELENRFDQIHLKSNLIKIIVMFFSIFIGNLSLLPLVFKNTDISIDLKLTIISFPYHSFLADLLHLFCCLVFLKKSKLQNYV